MPRGPNKYPQYIALRVSPEDKAKIDHLASLTRRSPAGVLRELIRIAQASDVPSLRFAPEAPGAGEAGGVVVVEG